MQFWEVVNTESLRANQSQTAPAIVEAMCTLKGAVLILHPERDIPNLHYHELEGFPCAGSCYHRVKNNKSHPV